MPFAIDPNAPRGHPMHGPAPGLRLKAYGAAGTTQLGDDDDWDDDWDLDPEVLAKIREGAEDELSVEGMSTAELEVIVVFLRTKTLHMNTSIFT